MQNVDFSHLLNKTIIETIEYDDGYGEVIIKTNDDKLYLISSGLGFVVISLAKDIDDLRRNCTWYDERLNKDNKA